MFMLDTDSGAANFRFIEETTRSTFANSGQICLATERLYVERPVFDAFVEGLAASARADFDRGPVDTSGTGA